MGLIFVFATRFLNGECIGKLSLENMKKNFNKFSSNLGRTFDPNKEEEWIVLEQLENVCAENQFNAEMLSYNASKMEEKGYHIYQKKRNTFSSIPQSVLSGVQSNTLYLF